MDVCFLHGMIHNLLTRKRDGAHVEINSFRLNCIWLLAINWLTQPNTTQVESSALYMSVFSVRLDTLCYWFSLRVYYLRHNNDISI